MKNEHASNMAKEKQCCGVPRLFKRLLVAIDGSEPAEFAAEAASRLAGQLHAEIVLLNVFSAAFITTPEIGFVAPDRCATCVEAADRILSRVREKMPNPSHVEMVLRDGDPVREIIEAAVMYDVDLIVMGTHARQGIAQAAIQSVADAVTQRAVCPVLIVAYKPDDKTAGRKANVNRSLASALQ